MITLLKALFAVGVLWLVGRAVDWNAALENVSRLSPATVASAFGLLLIQLLIVSERLRSVLRMLGQAVSYWTVFRATAEGSFFGQTLISLLGSDAARIWRCRRSGVPLVIATSGVVLDRFVGLSANHFMLLAAFPWVLPRIDDLWVKAGMWLLAVGFMAGIVIVCLFGKIAVPKILMPGSRLAKLAPLFDIARVSRYLFQNRAKTLVVLANSVVLNLINVGLFYILLKDLGARVDFLHCLLVVPIVIQLSLIPISIGGWGVRESATVIGFSYWGVPGDIALASSILFGVLTMIFSLWGGLLWWIDRDRPKPEMPAC